MPHLVTMLRARPVAYWMSDEAPERDLVVAEDDLLGHAAAHADREVRVHLVAVVRVVVALGQAHDHAQRAAARDDRRLVDRVRRRLVTETIAWPAS